MNEYVNNLKNIKWFCSRFNQIKSDWRKRFDRICQIISVFSLVYKGKNKETRKSRVGVFQSFSFKRQIDIFLHFKEKQSSPLIQKENEKSATNERRAADERRKFQKKRRKFSKDLSNWPRGFAAFGTIVEQVRLSVIWATPISTGETWSEQDPQRRITARHNGVRAISFKSICEDRTTPSATLWRSGECRAGRSWILITCAWWWLRYRLQITRGGRQVRSLFFPESFNGQV